jgi:hypothetical protein
MMGGFNRITSGEAGEFWRFIDEAEKEIESWPQWKQKQVLFPERAVRIEPRPGNAPVRLEGQSRARGHRVRG